MRGIQPLTELTGQLQLFMHLLLVLFYQCFVQTLIFTLITGIPHFFVHHFDVRLQRVGPRGRELTQVAGDPYGLGIVAVLPVLLELLGNERGVLTLVAGKHSRAVVAANVIFEFDRVVGFVRALVTHEDLDEFLGE